MKAGVFGEGRASRAPPRNLLIAAAAGLGLTAVLALFDGRGALQGYHVAVVYWAGIAVGALLINMSFLAARARWHTLIRRVIEAVPLVLPLLALLFVPIVLFAGSLFPWVNPAGLEGEAAHLAHHRHAYLNLTFFIIRAIVFFGLWIAVAHLLYRWSSRQDVEGGAELTLRRRMLGAGALPFVGFALTFAAFDWQMSLSMEMASTIFGLYYFAGSFLSSFAVVILALVASRREGLPGALMNANHWHSLGKYLLAFVAFWGYIALSQYLLIWIANLPEEVPWYLARNRGVWLPLAIFLVVFHFLVPFFLLLSRRLKRNPRALAFVAVWVLVVHYVDVYWVMMPALRGEGSLMPHLADLTSLVGVGAAGVAFVAWRMRGVPAIPVGDPNLAESLRYDPS